MAERTVEFKFVANADLAGVEQFGKALGALDKKINDVSDKSLRALGREVLDVSKKFKQSPQNIRAAASALNLLAQSATAGSSAYLKLSGDAQKLTSDLDAITRATTAASVANQAFGGSANAMKQQISTLSQGLGTLKFKSQEYVQTLQRITELQAVMSARQGRLATQAAQAAYAGPTMQRGFGSAALLPDFAFTPAGYQQRISELKNQLNNTEFGAARQEVQQQIAQAERELKSLSTTYGSVAQSAKAAAAANRELARSQQAVSGGNAAARITGLTPPPIVTSAEIAGRQYFQNQVVRPGMLALPPAGGTQATAMAERAATEAEAQVDRARQRWERVRAKLDAQAGAFNASGARVMAGGGAFQGPSLARAGMLALPAAGGSSFQGGFDSRGFGGGARARIRGAEIPGRILFDASSRQDIRGGNAFAGPEFGVGYSQTYGAAPSSQLPPGYFDTRRRMLGQESRAGLSSARTGNRFMAAGAISAGAFFGGPEGAAGGLIGAAIGGPAAALGGASIGAQVGIVRKQLGEFASLEAQLAKYNIALENVAGSQAEFARAQAAITSANERLNIPLLEGTQSFTQLAAAVVGAGGNINDAELAFNAVNSAIKATGGNSRDVEGALLAITQVFSKGKVSAEELRRQLGDRLPGAFNLFAASIGKTGPELDKALQDGKVTLNDLMTFLLELEKRYAETAEEIAGSSQDAGARLTKAWEQARLAVGKALQPLGAEIQEMLIGILEKATPRIEKFLDQLRSNPEELKRAVQEVGRAIEVVGRITEGLLQGIQGTTRALLSLKSAAEGVAAVSPAGVVGNLLMGRNPFQQSQQSFSQAQQLFAASQTDGRQMNSAFAGAAARLLGPAAGDGSARPARPATTPTSRDGLTNFPVEDPEGRGADNAARRAADQASRDAERLAAEQRRLAEANAQLRRRLDRQLFEYQLELDQKRYENLRRLSDLAQQNEINSLPAAQRRIAGLVAELRGAMLDVSDRRRSANLAVQDAQQRLQGAQQYESTVGAFTVPARDGGASTGSASGRPVPPQVIEYLTGDPAMRGTRYYDPAGHGGAVHHEHFAFQTTAQRDLAMRGLQARGITIGSVDRPGDPGYHGSRQAFDVPAYPNFQRLGLPDNAEGERRLGAMVRGALWEIFGGSGSGPAGSPAVRAEIGNIRAEGGVEEAQNALRQAEELQKQVEQFAAAEISAYVDRFVIGTLQPIRDRTEAQRDELDVLKLRNRLLLEGADPAVIQLEEELLQLRKGQAAETTRLNAALKEAQDRLKEATDSGDASAIAKATAEVQGLEAAIEELPAAIDESAAATRNLFNESQRLEEPWERLQLAIVNVKKELKDLQDPVNQIKNLATGIGDAFGNSFGSAITGSSSVREALSNLFRDIGNLFADMVSRIIAKAIEAQILQGAQGSGGGLFGFIGSALFGGLGGSLSGGGASFGGGYFDPLTGLGAAGPNFGFAKGGGFAKNNIVPYATGGIVDSPTLFKFANGGTTRTGLMGEAGPEAILPLRRTASGDLGVIAAGGNRGGGIVNQVTVNVDAKGSSVSGDNNESRKLGAVISDAVRAELVKQQRPGGILGSNRTKSR
jgi:tape measure domain-containing protein